MNQEFVQLNLLADPENKFQNNPFAICSAQIDRDKEPAKWERCVMKVKKELALSENLCEVFGEEIPGGAYLAEQDKDGEFWSIRDVPFFSELPAGIRNNEQPISREWMESVLAKHRELEAEQKHLPPVHINHHDSGRENFRIGFLRPTRVGRLVLDGKPKWTLFGDIIRIENYHFEEIRNVRYPYRSAEIGRGWKPEIASLALSEDESPHFKFPMLTIGEERVHFDRKFSPSQRPAMAFSEVGESAYICFSFKGAAMPEPKTENLAGHENGKDGDGDSSEQDKLAKSLAEIVKKFEAGLPALFESILQSLMPPTTRTKEGETAVEPAMLKERIAELLKEKSNDSETAVEPAMLKARIEELLKAKVEGSKETDKTVDKLSELRGEIDALKEKDRLREETDKSEALAETKIVELRTEGWHLSDDAVASIRDIAAESQTALDKYVKGYKATMPKDPPRTLEEAEIFSEESPDIAKYKTRSPEILESARELSKQYDQLKSGGAKLSSSREEFIDINLEVLTA